MQRALGGTIETYYPFEEEVCIFCNDEGKYNGMSPCRAIYGDDKKLMDLVFGPFFICYCSTDRFASLSKEELERFEKEFYEKEAKDEPEIFPDSDTSKKESKTEAEALVSMLEDSPELMTLLKAMIKGK